LPNKNPAAIRQSTFDFANTPVSRQNNRGTISIIQNSGTKTFSNKDETGFDGLAHVNEILQIQTSDKA
jgi:hypothetical protein